MLYRTLYGLRWLYLNIFNIGVTGTRLIALTPDNQVILVRHTYGRPDWMFPGGGLSTGDTPETGGLRELREEIGMIRHGAVESLGFYKGKMGRADDGIYVLVVRDVHYQPPRFSFEIAAVQAFPLNALPHDISPGTARRLAEWQGQVPASAVW